MIRVLISTDLLSDYVIELHHEGASRTTIGGTVDYSVTAYSITATAFGKDPVTFPLRAIPPSTPVLEIVEHALSAARAVGCK